MSNKQAEFHLVQSVIGRHLFVTNGSRLYDIDYDGAFTLDDLEGIIEDLSSTATRWIDAEPIAPPPLQTLSLNVAQACNMGCGYCYADKGKFKGKARVMSIEVARSAVDRLIAESRVGADLVIGFMGGEPFLNRRLLHEIMPYAEMAAAARGHKIRFSLTTNATLLEPQDVRLLADHNVQVAISIDGPKSINDSVRSLNNGGSAYAQLLHSLDLFERKGWPRHLSARITVTPAARDLPRILDHVLSLGFDSAGFAAVLVSPDIRYTFSKDDFKWFLSGMVACGEKAKNAILSHDCYPFSNFETALYEIHRGSHRPYPCGAGAAYLSVNADGEMFTCHRLIDDPTHRMGTVWDGSDVAARARHLAARHVDRQEPCRSCWARYLCGGGCYHEIDRRGRLGCDYIRGWLDYCLSTYAEIRETSPDYFDGHSDYFSTFAAQGIDAPK